MDHPLLLKHSLAINTRYFFLVCHHDSCGAVITHNWENHLKQHKTLKFLSAEEKETLRALTHQFPKDPGPFEDLKPVEGLPLFEGIICQQCGQLCETRDSFYVHHSLKHRGTKSEFVKASFQQVSKTQRFRVHFLLFLSFVPLFLSLLSLSLPFLFHFSFFFFLSPALSLPLPFFPFPFFPFFSLPIPFTFTFRSFSISLPYIFDIKPITNDQVIVDEMEMPTPNPMVSWEELDSSTSVIPKEVMPTGHDVPPFYQQTHFHQILQAKTLEAILKIKAKEETEEEKSIASIALSYFDLIQKRVQADSFDLYALFIYL